VELWLLKNDVVPRIFIVDVLSPIDDEGEDIRCPRCGWHPSPSSRWSCVCDGTPEPPFMACGTVWNTFSTRGRCPGCSHQWRWTSCLSCGESSPHQDWYEKGA